MLGNTTSNRGGEGRMERIIAQYTGKEDFIGYLGHGILDKFIGRQHQD